MGNKTDLGEQDEREVSTETGETFSKVCSVSYRSFEGRGGEGRGGEGEAGVFWGKFLIQWNPSTVDTLGTW